MLNPLLLLPLAFSIESITAIPRADSLTVEMRTSEPVTARQVRGLKGPHRLYVFVQDGDASSASIQGAKMQVLQRARYAKLEVTLPAGMNCQEPALVEPTADGIRARYSCTGGADEESAAVPALPAPRTQAREILQAALALPEGQAYQEESAVPAAPTADPPATAARAVGAVPAEASERAAEAKPAPTAVANRAMPQPVAAEPASSAKVVPAEAAPLPKVVPPAPEAAPSSAPAASNPAPYGVSVVAPALVLLALAAGAFVLNRRRGRRQGLIQILETASIGPKRSLLVARVDGRTMVLGASEAGISLLQSLDGGGEVREAAVAPESAPAAPESVAALAAALATSPAASEAAPEAVVGEPAPEPAADEGEADNEGGLLRRLFARAVGPTKSAPDFRSLLDESLEDQDLRRKLSQGLSARVA